MDDISQRRAAIWRMRLKRCMDERGLTQLAFVTQLNRQFLTKYHQKDISRWLNTGNRTASGVIGFPKYETMMLIAEFFNVDVGYLTGESDEETFSMQRACDFTGLDSTAVRNIRDWTGAGASCGAKDGNVGDSQDGVDDTLDGGAADADMAPSDADDAAARELRRRTIDAFLGSEEFPKLVGNMLTLCEMSSMWRDSPEKFASVMASVAEESDLQAGFTAELMVNAFYGIANVSFQQLLHNAYPIPDRSKINDLDDGAADDGDTSRSGT